MLADAGVPLGCQTVLLKGVNDDPAVMKRLMQALLKARVRPYYIYQADVVAGGEHFRTSIQKGLEIIQALRGWTSGMAVPHFVIDAPGGGGKIPLLPEYVQAITEDEVILRNYAGKEYRYPLPKRGGACGGRGGGDTSPDTPPGNVSAETRPGRRHARMGTAETGAKALPGETPLEKRFSGNAAGANACGWERRTGERNGGNDKAAKGPNGKSAAEGVHDLVVLGPVASIPSKG
jgi:hypothetical protein